MTGTPPPVGLASAANQVDSFAQLEFVVSQLMGRNQTATIVQVIAVHDPDAIAPVGYVDLQPMVHQMDGNGKAQPHGPVHNVPFFRLQGGTRAVIIDPRVGDIGLALFASHDISRVKNTRKAGLPGSRRRFDMSDGFYLGGILNQAPTEYVRFSDEGVTVKAHAIKLDAPVVTVTGDVVASGISLVHHTHGGVQAGGAMTGPPV